MIAVFFKSIILPLLASYVSKLATKEFAHWAFMQIGQAIVDSTETPEDNKWFDKIKRTIENK